MSYDNVVWCKVSMNYITSVHLFYNRKQLDAKEQHQPLRQYIILHTISMRTDKILQKSTIKEIIKFKVQYFKHFKFQVLTLKTLRKCQCHHLQPEFHNDRICSRSSFFLCQIWTFCQWSPWIQTISTQNNKENCSQQNKCKTSDANKIQQHNQ